jgi:hypothetical protein
MRIKLLLVFLSFYCWQAYAQSEFPLAWQADHGFKAKVKSCNNETSLFFGANDDQASMIDANGKNLWKVSVDKFGLKDVEPKWICKPNIVILHQPGGRKSTATTVFVDGKAGNELWRTEGITAFGFDGVENVKDSYLPDLNALLIKRDQKLALVNVTTGKTIWENNSFDGKKTKSFECYNLEGTDLLDVVINDKEHNYFDLANGTPVAKITASHYAKRENSKTTMFDEKENILVNLYYGRGFLATPVGNDMSITLTGRQLSTGDVLWTTTIEGKVVTTMYEKKQLLDAFIKNGHVFVVYEGISVLDLKTGKLQWKSVFNNSEIDNNLKGAKQQFNISDFPLVDGNSVYIVDLTKETYGIKKVDANTGNIIWKTEKYSSSDIIPHIALVNGVLVAQFGGVVDYQIWRSGTYGPTITKTYKYRGNPGIKAFDPATGKLLWDEDKLGEKKLGNTSNFLFNNGLAYFMTEKNLYVVNVTDGSVKQKVDLKEVSLGDPIKFELNTDNNKCIVLMEKGICAIDLVQGNVLYKTPVKDVTGWLNKSGNYFLLIGDDQDQYVGIDINSGKVRGKHSGSTDNISSDGKCIVEYDGGKVKKYEVL